ncbi:MAG: ATP-binding protein [Desulfurivibrionaceae bacterium]
MNDSAEPHKSKIMSVPIQRFTWILVGAWTLFTSGLSFSEISGIREITQEIAISEIRAYCNKDRALRTWGASHGGVYVPVDERTPANPYLAHLPERDMVTPSGRALTLMNPAYMMRQVGEDFSSLYGVVARMTSLKPLRPENAPDVWERRALEEFVQSRQPEKIEFSQIAGVPHLRLIQAVMVKQDCLQCHGHQGYKEGDIRGGISVSLSMVDALALEKKQIFSHLIRAGLIWFIGVAGLLFGGGLLQRRIAERDAAQEALQRSLDRLARKSEEMEGANATLLTEIAERKKAEAEILVSEEKFRTVADFTYDWEYWMDPAGDFLYVSPASERITGYRPEEFRENPGLFLEITHPDHKGQLENHFRQAVAERRVCMLEFRIITRDGQERWIGHTCQPVYGQSGEFLGNRASNRDITGNKWSEKTLNKFAVELSQSNRDLQDFAYMASHDLREPLVLIQAFSERLLARYGDNIPEKGLEYIRRIDAATLRMQELISGVLAYSRVSVKAQPFEEVDLAKIIQGVLGDLELVIRKSQGEIEVGPLGRIKADPLQIRQLFQNLIVNALKYRRSEVVPQIRVSCHSITVALGEEHGEFCQVTVEDNGIGFAEEAAGQIFGLFQRLHGRSQYEGTGIGLAVCKRIVERHGGTITAESSPGRGARFIVTLPVHGPAVDDLLQLACQE